MPYFFRPHHIFFPGFATLSTFSSPKKPGLGFAASTTLHCPFEALPPPYLNIFGPNPQPLAPLGV